MVRSLQRGFKGHASLSLRALQLPCSGLNLARPKQVEKNSKNKEKDATKKSRQELFPKAPCSCMAWYVHGLDRDGHILTLGFLYMPRSMQSLGLTCQSQVDVSPVFDQLGVRFVGYNIIYSVI